MKIRNDVTEPAVEMLLCHLSVAVIQRSADAGTRIASEKQKNKNKNNLSLDPIMSNYPGLIRFTNTRSV